MSTKKEQVYQSVQHDTGAAVCILVLSVGYDLIPEHIGHGVIHQVSQRVSLVVAGKVNPQVQEKVKEVLEDYDEHNKE